MPWREPLQPPQTRANRPGGLRVPRASSRAKPRSKWSPDGRDRHTPVRRHRGDWTPVTTPPLRALVGPSRGSEPPDRDLTVLIRTYRFGLLVLLKSPCIFLESTRSPAPLKNICGSAHILVFRPLDSLEIEPAV
jgi:hypothetical protein